VDKAYPGTASSRSSKLETVSLIAAWDRDADLLAYGRQYRTADGGYLANGDLASRAINKGLDIAQRIIDSSRLFHCRL